MKRCILITLGLFLVSFAHPTTKLFADTSATHFHVLTDSTWKYTTVEEPNWFTAAFSDSAWPNVVAPSGGECSADTPHWGSFDESPLPGSDALPIWGQNPQSFQTVFIRKLFTLATDTTGTIRAAADDELDLYVNGVLVVSEANLQAGPIVEASVSLPAGRNVIAMKAFDSVGGCQAAIADFRVLGTRCSDTEGTILGTAGRDVLTGGPGRDVIVAFGGNDSINGAGGDDLICGGDGADTITAGTGNDTVFAQAGADTVAGSSGNDRLYGEHHADVLRGGKGQDTVIGGRGADTMSGDLEDDLLIGGLGNDSYRGGSGDDTASFAAAPTGVRVSLLRRVARGDGVDTISGIERLRGSRFADRLFGSPLADTLHGLMGNDVLVGAGGYDRLFGGRGRDRCADGEVNSGCEATRANP